MNQAFMASALFWTLAPNSATGALDEPYQAEVRGPGTRGVPGVRDDFLLARRHPSAVRRLAQRQSGAATQSEGRQSQSPGAMAKAVPTLQTRPAGQANGLRLRT